MFLMEKSETYIVIDTINEYLKECLWMDFSLVESHLGKIQIYGAVDQTYNNYKDNYEILIEFDWPYFISSVLTWRLDDSKPFIELVSGQEAVEFQTIHPVEQGKYIFKINADVFQPTPLYIVAKKISCKILNEHPFDSK